MQNFFVCLSMILCFLFMSSPFSAMAEVNSEEKAQLNKISALVMRNYASQRIETESIKDTIKSLNSNLRYYRASLRQNNSDAKTKNNDPSAYFSEFEKSSNKIKSTKDNLGELYSRQKKDKKDFLKTNAESYLSDLISELNIVIDKEKFSIMDVDEKKKVLDRIIIKTTVKRVEIYIPKHQSPTISASVRPVPDLLEKSIENN